MSIDMNQCVIRRPAGEEVRRLYRALGEIFASDRPMYERMTAGTFDLSDWRWFTMFAGETVVGNACLVPLSVWLGGRTVELWGVGAVATVAAYRRMGVARRLMQHLMAEADRDGRASVLYTCVPAVYEPFGFRAVRQAYWSVRRADAAFSDGGLERRVVKTLDEDAFSRVKDIYENRYPNYDGKVVRTDRYWSFYRVILETYERPYVVLGFRGGRCVGYLRLEREADRMLVGEMCGGADAGEGLLRLAWDIAAEWGVELITLALPAGHSAWGELKRKGIEISPEVGGNREVFMVREGARAVEGLSELQWSLADKF